MDHVFPILFAGVVGFTHAFEIDHLVAVSNIVTRRNSVLLAIKDGIYWGLGHSSTILLIGTIMIAAKVSLSARFFGGLEALVGVMLVILGVQRLFKSVWQRPVSAHLHEHPHDQPHPQGHRLAYGVGLVHGLAGSGALVLLVMSQMTNAWAGMGFLCLFGLGSIVGMLLASGVFSLPFSQKLSANKNVHRSLTVISSVLCIAFGAKVIFENLALL